MKVPVVKDSYFKTCKRDRQGHCLPKNQQGGTGTQIRHRKLNQGRTELSSEAASEENRIVRAKRIQLLKTIDERARAEPNRPLTASGKRAYSRLLKSIETSDLDPDVKRDYAEGIHKILGRMPEEAAKRVADNVQEINWYKTGKDLTRFIVTEQADEVVKELIAEGESVRAVERQKQEYINERLRSIEINGAYRMDMKRILLDGGSPPTDQDSVGLGTREIATAYMVHAHELTHAIDGQGNEISTTQEWRDAGMKEILSRDPDNVPLTRYAMSGPNEGFAEFGRLLYGGGFDPAEVEKKFPKCSAVFKKWNLWPKT